MTPRFEFTGRYTGIYLTEIHHESAKNIQNISKIDWKIYIYIYIFFFKICFYFSHLFIALWYINNPFILFAFNKTQIYIERLKVEN